eukprot:COSAG01_NODE_7898_length_3001_cov_4.345968_4_plen_168_part_00
MSPLRSGEWLHATRDFALACRRRRCCCAARPARCRPPLLKLSTRHFWPHIQINQRRGCRSWATLPYRAQMELEQRFARQGLVWRHQHEISGARTRDCSAPPPLGGLVPTNTTVAVRTDTAPGVKHNRGGERDGATATTATEATGVVGARRAARKPVRRFKRPSGGSS